jgi:uncharacterized membrane protein
MVEYSVTLLPEYKIKLTLTVERKYLGMFGAEYGSVLFMSPIVFILSVRLLVGLFYKDEGRSC